MKKGIVRRFIPVGAAAPVGLVTRADGSKAVTGTAAVFYNAGDAGTEYKLWRDVFERIMPTAFDRALAEAQDVRGLFNHNPDLILGRTAAGTMRLKKTAAGLDYEIDPPDTAAGRDVAVSLERGDVTGSSFAFVPRRVSWVEETDGAGNRREICQVEDVDLYDVGPVTFPAYAATSAGVRSDEELADVRASYDAWKREAGPDTAAAVDVRRRLVELDLLDLQG